MSTKIVSVDLRMPITLFQTQLDEQVDDWSEKMVTEVKPGETKNGKKVYTVSIKNDADNANVKFVAEQDDVSKDIIFRPLKMGKMNNDFYNFDCSDYSLIGTDDDPVKFAASALEQICMANKGTVAIINDSDAILVRNGHKAKSEIGIVAEDGSVFSRVNAKDIGLNDGDMDTEFHVKQPINEWLAEHADVAQAIAKLPTINDKMNFVGKYLIQARNNDEIESEEFMDIFRQAGLFGFTDNTVKMVYKLIM